MRILLVTNAPLHPESGAGQMAVNLAQALADRGHEAVTWSTKPLPPGARWWNHWRLERRSLEQYLADSPAVDVLDLPPILLSRQAARKAPIVVARSIQPDLRYNAVAARARRDRLHAAPHRLLAERLHFTVLRKAIVAGWKRAGIILCLGTHELRWMRARFPALGAKLQRYDSALSAGDQEVLAAIRSQRRSCAGQPYRFLWIGRWAAHKGTARLLELIQHRFDENPCDRFTIAGCGAAAHNELPPPLASDERLQLVPQFSRRELRGTLEAHNAGLFTSTVEGWGLSLNEMLESGMPVFATEAGGVEDLRPFFPNSLRPFPPPPGRLPKLALEDLSANGYQDRFSWSDIAQRYESMIERFR